MVDADDEQNSVNSPREDEDETPLRRAARGHNTRLQLSGFKKN
jgi:hypothetical protein